MAACEPAGHRCAAEAGRSFCARPLNPITVRPSLSHRDSLVSARRWCRRSLTPKPYTLHPTPYILNRVSLLHFVRARSPLRRRSRSPRRRRDSRSPGAEAAGRSPPPRRRDSRSPRRRGPLPDQDEDFRRSGYSRDGDRGGGRQGPPGEGGGGWRGGGPGGGGPDPQWLEERRKAREEAASKKNSGIYASSDDEVRFSLV